VLKAQTGACFAEHEEHWEFFDIITLAHEQQLPVWRQRRQLHAKRFRDLLSGEVERVQDTRDFDHVGALATPGVNKSYHVIVIRESFAANAVKSGCTKSTSCQRDTLSERRSVRAVINRSNAPASWASK
jgi:hypothetical protein